MRNFNSLFFSNLMMISIEKKKKERNFLKNHTPKYQPLLTNDKITSSISQTTRVPGNKR